jgi:hypothetical protein
MDADACLDQLPWKGIRMLDITVLISPLNFHELTSGALRRLVFLYVLVTFFSPLALWVSAEETHARLSSQDVICALELEYKDLNIPVASSWKAACDDAVA